MDLRKWYGKKEEPAEELDGDKEGQIVSVKETELLVDKQPMKELSVRMQIELKFIKKDEIFLTTNGILTDELEEMFKALGGQHSCTLFNWIFPLPSYSKLKFLLQSKKNVDLQDLPRFVSHIISELSTQKPVCSEPSISDLPEELLSKMYKFQIEGVKFVISKGGRALIGDEMGVGKTLQAIASSYLYRNEWPLLVLCPASLRVNWREEFFKWIPELKRNEIYLVDAKNSPSPFTKVWISSYNLAISLEKLLKAQDFDVIIADECHYLKSYKAKRTKMLLPMIQKAKRAIMISGTPIISRPQEIYNILAGLRPSVFRNFLEFGSRYCDPKPAFKGFDYSGSSNLNELYVLLTSTIMIRRLKSDVLSQLPPKIRQKIEIQIDKTHCKELRKKYSDLKKSKKSANDSNEMIYNQYICDSYKLTAKAKMKGVTEYINYLLENDCKFLVFAHHQDMLDAIVSTVKAAGVEFIRIDGNTPTEVRGEYVNCFQVNSSCKVAVLSITAAGIGLTLTAANLVVVAEMAWSPSTMIQAEDRVHRIGQQKVVNIHYLFGPGTLDEYIWPLIQEKLNIVCETLDNDSNPENESLFNPLHKVGLGDFSELFEEIDKFSNRVIFISLECLVKYPSKEKKSELKNEYWNSLSAGFVFNKTPTSPEKNYISQLNQYVSGRLLDLDLIDLTGYKAYEESVSVLKELNNVGFNVVVISDSNYKAWPLKVLRSFGLEDLVHCLITYSEINEKKSSLEYFPKIFSFLSIDQNSEIWVVGNKVYKEVKSAAKAGLKHIWINQLVNDIVKSIQELSKNTLENEIQYPRSVMSLNLLLNAISHYEPVGKKVAYMLPTAKKMNTMGLKKTFSSSSSIWYNSIWPYCSPSKTGNFQVFINKAVDLLSMQNKESLQAFQNWQAFLSQHPEIIAIDPLDKCKDWLTREDFIRNLSECANIEINNVKFRVPFQLKVSPACNIDDISIEFPVIVKANTASVSKMSHIMSVVFTKTGLRQALNVYEEDCIIQEFINHDMTVYKIYVIGNEIEYKARASCSNINFAGKDCVTFNSAEPWPEDLKSGSRVTKQLNMEAIYETTKRISSHLGLSIYGYDILVHSSTEDYIIVDVNVFPGFKEYQDLNPILASHINSYFTKT